MAFLSSSFKQLPGCRFCRRRHDCRCSRSRTFCGFVLLTRAIRCWSRSTTVPISCPTAQVWPVPGRLFAAVHEVLLEDVRRPGAVDAHHARDHARAFVARSAPSCLPRVPASAPGSAQPPPKILETSWALNSRLAEAYRRCRHRSGSQQAQQTNPQRGTTSRWPLHLRRWGIRSRGPGVRRVGQTPVCIRPSHQELHRVL